MREHFFEIYASRGESDEIRSTFNQLHDSSIETLSYLIQPLLFKESDVDEKRDAYFNKLVFLYNQIYELGTEDTRKSMVDSGIINPI